MTSRPPGQLLDGRVAFRADDISPPLQKHYRYLKKKEKLRQTLWTGEKKKKKDDDSVTNLLAKPLSRKDVTAFL
jgi:hypothetical protein